MPASDSDILGYRSGRQSLHQKPILERLILHDLVECLQEPLHLLQPFDLDKDVVDWSSILIWPHAENDKVLILILTTIRASCYACIFALKYIPEF